MNAIDTADTSRFETNLTAHRKLAEELKYADLRLQLWAPWARPKWGTGWPSRSTTELAGEGGLLARDSTPHEPHWPTDVVRTEEAVVRLPNRHLAAVMAHYFNMGLPTEERSVIFITTLRNLHKTRPVPRNVIAGRCGMGTFRDDLDRGRWTVKALLQV